MPLRIATSLRHEESDGESGDQGRGGEESESSSPLLMTRWFPFQITPGDGLSSSPEDPTKRKRREDANAKHNRLVLDLIQRYWHQKWPQEQHSQQQPGMGGRTNRGGGDLMTTMESESSLVDNLGARSISRAASPQGDDFDEYDGRKRGGGGGGRNGTAAATARLRMNRDESSASIT